MTEGGNGDLAAKSHKNAAAQKNEEAIVPNPEFYRRFTQRKTD
jgi:hypothetical protein